MTPINTKLTFYLELVLYGLDVYYQQMFGEDPRFIPEDSSHYNSKIDYQTVGNNYGNYYASSTLKHAYHNNLPYYDQFHGRYRNFGPGWKNLDKIPQWIETANEV